MCIMHILWRLLRRIVMRKRRSVHWHRRGVVGWLRVAVIGVRRRRKMDVLNKGGLVDGGHRSSRDRNDLFRRLRDRRRGNDCDWLFRIGSKGRWFLGNDGFLEHDDSFLGRDGFFWRRVDFGGM